MARSFLLRTLEAIIEKRQMSPAAAVAALAKNRGELGVEALNRLVACARAASVISPASVQAPRTR